MNAKNLSVNNPLAAEQPEKFHIPFDKLMQNIAGIGEAKVMAVAVSGGVDSMALTLLAHDWGQKTGRKIIALTVDHGLRKEAKNETRMVKKWLEEKEIEHHTLEYKGKKPTANIMEAARNIRYRLMAEWCRDNMVKHLMVAHNMEDQAETFMMHLNRGSLIDGLSAMAAVSNMHGISILRPLLSTSRKDLQKLLKDMGQQWLEDPTNKNLKYARNSIRYFLSANPEAAMEMTRKIFATTSAAGRARMALEEITDREITNCTKLYKEGFVSLNTNNFNRLPEEIKLRLLIKILGFINDKPHKPRFEKLERLLESIKNGDKKTRTLWGCTISPAARKNEESHIIFCKEPASIENMTIARGEEKLWDRRFLLKLAKNLPEYSGKLSVETLLEQDVQYVRERGHTILRTLPAPVIYTLPVLKLISENGLETLLSAPHINFMAEGWKGAFSYEFKPTKPLRGDMFTCCADVDFAVA